MIKKIFIYLKFQYKLITVLVLFILAPYYLQIEYLPEIPHTEIIFLVILILIKISFYPYKKRDEYLEKYALKELNKELTSSPSQKKMFKRVNFYQSCQDFTLGLIAFIIIMSGLLMGRF